MQKVRTYKYANDSLKDTHIREIKNKKYGKKNKN